jgi:hypothetical protein
MKKILICLMSLVFVCSVGLLTAEEKDPLDEYEGKFWSELEALDKVCFLQGFLAGIRACHTEIKYYKEVLEDPEEGDKDKAEVIGEVLDYIKSVFNCFGLSYGQLSDGLDALYKDEANKVIPINRVITAVAEKIKGEIDDASYNAYIVELRDEYKK